MSKSGQSAWWGRVARAWGLDPRLMAALLRAYLLMDLRNQQFARATGTRHRELFTPLFWIVSMNLFISCVASAVLFGRVDAYFFALVGLSISMLITATSLIVEFNEVVLSVDDVQVIGHHPVPARTYAAARVGNLLMYLSAIIASTSIFPAIVGVGLRDASVWYLPAYLAATLFGNLAVAGAVISLYAFLSRGRPDAPIQEYLAWMQAALMAVTFYGGQFALRDQQNRLELLAYQPPEWFSLLPSAWLAAFVADTGPGGTGDKWWVLATCVVFSAVIWRVVLRQLSASYAELEPGGSSWRSSTRRPLPRPGQLLGPFGQLCARNQDEQTGFWLATTMLRRIPSLRLHSLPFLSMVPAALLLGYFTDQLPNPLETSDPRCVLTLAGLYLLPTCVPAIFYSLRFAEDFEASWVLHSAPIENPWRFMAGVRKAVTHQILAPVMLFVFVMLWIAFGRLADAIVQSAVAWSVTILTSYWSQGVVLRTYPFSQSPARGAALGPVAPYLAAASLITMVAAGLHYGLAQMGRGFTVYAMGVVIFTLFATWYVSRQTWVGLKTEVGLKTDQAIRR